MSSIGGAIVVFTVPLLDKLKIDDVVGAIPVHLFAGIWGTLIVPFSNGEKRSGPRGSSPPIRTNCAAPSSATN